MKKKTPKQIQLTQFFAQNLRRNYRFHFLPHSNPVVTNRTNPTFPTDPHRQTDNRQSRLKKIK
jgi:hypothetical protein